MKLLQQSKIFDPDFSARVARVDEIIWTGRRISVVKTCNRIVVVPKNVQVGDIRIFCPLGTELDGHYLSVNNEYDITNADANSNIEEIESIVYDLEMFPNHPCFKQRLDYLHTILCGHFDSSNKVKYRCFCGFPSFGYSCSTEAFEKAYPEAKQILWNQYINMKFDSINGKLFCWKHEIASQTPRIVWYKRILGNIKHYLNKKWEY